MDPYMLLAGSVVMGLCGCFFKKENQIWVALALMWMAFASF